MISRLRAWLFQSMLDELEAAHTRDLDALRDAITDLQIDAYRVGKAHGELLGRQCAIAEMQDAIGAKREITQADIDRARKGLVH
jgi:hypothetical protein